MSALFQPLRITFQDWSLLQIPDSNKQFESTFCLVFLSSNMDFHLIYSLSDLSAVL